MTQQHHINVVGLHAHAGSGINDAYHWATVAQFLIQLANTHFKDVSIIDLGGGLGLELDLTIIHISLQTIKNENPSYQFWMEPGRYWVARAGALLARVTQIKEKEGVHFVGLDVGMNSLIRPMLYAAHHPIVNLSRLSEPSEITAHVVGPICESGDILGYNRTLPKSREGNVFLIANAGAYGHVMSSHYNRRDPAHEHVL